MNRSITTDNPIMNFLTIVCDIVILHFLWLLTSLPILTIGASTTALYYTTMKCIRNGQGGVVKMFFKSFKDNFKQATGIGILALAAGFICIFDMYYAISRDIKGMMMFLVKEKSAHNLVNSLMGGMIQSSGDGFSDMELSALGEIGNIIIGAYLSAMSNLTSLKISSSVPYISIDMAGYISAIGKNKGELISLLNIQLAITDKDTSKED